MGLRNAVAGVWKRTDRDARRNLSIAGLALTISFAVPHAVEAPPLAVVAPHGVRGGAVADRVVVIKHRRELMTLRGDVVLRRYPIALGFNPVGHKRHEGDGRTPEGVYRLDWRHVSLTVGPAIHISYPNARDRQRAKAARRRPGGGIMLHSLDPPLPWTTAKPRSRMWTQGCIGMMPGHLEEIWHTVMDGTLIEIRP